MAFLSDDELTTQAEVIRDEEAVAGNTKERVYDMFKDVIDSKLSRGDIGQSASGIWKFDTSTSTSPASGRLRFDNATIGSVTNLYLSQTSNDGIDVGNFLSTVQIGDAFYIQQSDDGTKWLRVTVASALTDNGTWWTIPVTVVDNGTLMDNNADTIVRVTQATSGTSIGSQSANTVYAGPTGGGPATPTFRALVAADIPDLSSVYQVAGTYVTSVSGTSNRITSTGGLTPVIDIAATYVGQTSITTLGTITIGTWTGSVIGSSYGGAGAVNGILKANGSGVVSQATAGTDYLTPSGSGAALSGVWLLASGGTLTGANNVVGTTTNTYTHTFDSLGTTITDGAGMWMRNTTAAANGAQQISPVLTFEGRGWATTGSVSRSVIWRVHNLPVQGAAPTGQLRFTSEINGVATNGLLVLNSDGARVSLVTNGIQVLTNASGVGGLSFNGSAPTGGQITYTPGSFAFGTSSSWIAAGSGISFSLGNAIQHTSGTAHLYNYAGTINPSSGTAVFNIWTFSDTINQTGGANGLVTGLNIVPTVNACAAFTAMNYDPVNPGNVSGAHYGVRIVPTTVYSAFGLGTPTALVHIGAVTTARASLCINPGSTTTAPSSPVSGDIWHEGTGNRLMFRQGGTSTEVIVTSSVNSVSPTAPNRTFTVQVGNTTLYLHGKTTND